MNTLSPTVDINWFSWPHKRRDWFSLWFLQAVNQLCSHFEAYSDIPKITELREKFKGIKEMLKSHVFSDFARLLFDLNIGAYLYIEKSTCKLWTCILSSSWLHMRTSIHCAVYTTCFEYVDLVIYMFVLRKSPLQISGRLQICASEEKCFVSYLLSGVVWMIV